MAVMEDLSEDEAYLACLLADPSGIDIAEFAWRDTSPANETGIWRAWPFQWKWYHDESKYQIEQGARSLGKSLSIALRAFIFPFLHPGQQMVVTAPTLNHLNPIIDLIEDRFLSTRLSKSMLPKGTNHGITHKPFDMNFLNGTHIMGRIPRMDGSGIKGCVGQDSLVLTQRGWVFIPEVTTDDYVWSHLNRWSKVIQTQSFEAETVEIKGQGSFPITVTENHRFYVRNDISKQPGKTKRVLGDLHWEMAADLHSSKYSPINSYWSSPKSFDGVDVVYPQFSDASISRDCRNVNFWWLVGRYLADGITSMSKKSQTTPVRIDLFVHPKDHAEVTQRLDDMDWHYRITERAHSSACSISFCSAPIGAWLAKYFGKRAEGKEIPTFCFTMEKRFRRALFEGYLSGDGHRGEHGNQKRINSGSASKKLTMGIGTLATTLGYHVGYGVSEIKVDEIMGVKLKKKPFDSYIVRMNVNGDGYETDEFMHYKIRSVTPAGIQTVYNIVSEDHSYLSDGIINHNTHPLHLEMDEASDYPEAGWTEIHETLQSGVPGSMWRAHGVTRGVRDSFFKFTQPDSGWRVHRLAAMSRPNWTDEERQKKIKDYGSKNSPDYRRNILGLHGDATSPLFDLGRLLKCCAGEHRSVPSDAEYNTDVYQYIRVNSEKLEDYGGDIETLLPFNARHKNMGKRFWAGADIGFTNDPTEILIFGETFPKDQPSHLTLLSRVHLERISHPDQVNAMIHIINFYGLSAFSMDKTGNGLPLFQDLQYRFPGAADTIKGYNFSEKVLAGFDTTIQFDPDYGDPVEEQAIKKNVLQYSSDELRDFVDTGRITLPWDTELIGEFQGQTFHVVKDNMNIYGKKIYSQGSFHCLDAARMAILGFRHYELGLVAEMMQPEREEVLPIFVSF